MGKGKKGEISWIQTQIAQSQIPQIISSATYSIYRKAVNIKPIVQAIKTSDHSALHTILQECASDLTKSDISIIAAYAVHKQVTKLVAEVMSMHQVTNGRYGEMVDLMYSTGITHELTKDDVSFLGNVDE